MVCFITLYTNMLRLARKRPSPDTHILVYLLHLLKISPMLIWRRSRHCHRTHAYPKSTIVSIFFLPGRPPAQHKFKNCWHVIVRARPRPALALALHESIASAPKWREVKSVKRSSSRRTTQCPVVDGLTSARDISEHFRSKSTNLVNVPGDAYDGPEIPSLMTLLA